MRGWTKVWMTTVVLCIGLTLYEIPNVRLIWRCARTIDSHKRNYKNKSDLESALTKKIVATDPEAADILKYCLTDPNIEVFQISGQQVLSGSIDL